MNSWGSAILVGAGGFIGSVLRYGLSLLLQRQSMSFPHGTLWANLLGCLLIGGISTLAGETELLSPQSRLFLATGICGGFTTMSTFTYELSRFLKEADYLYATGYLVLTVFGCLAMFWLGVVAAKMFLKVV